MEPSKDRTTTPNKILDHPAFGSFVGTQMALPLMRKDPIIPMMNRSHNRRTDRVECGNISTGTL